MSFGFNFLAEVLSSAIPNARARYQGVKPVTDKNIGKRYRSGTYHEDNQPTMSTRNRRRLEEGKLSFEPINVTPRPDGETAFRSWPFPAVPKGKRLRHRTGQRPHFAKNALKKSLTLKQRRRLRMAEAAKEQENEVS